MQVCVSHGGGLLDKGAGRKDECVVVTTLIRAHEEFSYPLIVITEEEEEEEEEGGGGEGNHFLPKGHHLLLDEE